jgi:hypothetical protein
MKAHMKTRSLKDGLIEADILASRWLYLGNRASERGDRALAERHYGRAQKWHDRLNELAVTMR